MKTSRPSHYLRLLAYEPRTMAVFLLGGIFLASLQSRLFHSGTMLLFTSIVCGLILPSQFLTAAFPFLFKAPISGLKTAYHVVLNGEMEFLFTRAISRRSLFYARATRYLAAYLCPFLIMWGCSLAAPPIKVQIYSHDDYAAETEHFYLDHFPGAFIETQMDDGKEKSTCVVLPRGQANLAFYNLTLICFVALLFQLINFIFWQKRWSQLAVIIGVALVPMFFVGWFIFRMNQTVASEKIFSAFSATPAAYKSSLIWVTAHPFSAWSLLAVFAVATELYSCHRYIRTEPA
ncbi:MAG TPA: hypothetical protein VG733_16170 [Chthoniobacteraceae bacterium]|nr:hypothetical protein [Chthoniobacteraceae bacterium]